MSPKPDDRSDNVEKIQRSIDDTVRNMEQAEEMAALTDNPQTRDDLAAKNQRREQALKGMRKEIRDEALARERNERC